MNLLLAVGEFADAIALCKTYGPFLLGVVFFIWRDWKREQRLSERIDTLENEQRNIILPLVKDCAEVITRNTTVMERLESIIENS